MSEYTTLAAALAATGISFAESAWNPAPQTGSYGVYALEHQDGAVWADGAMKQQAMSGSVDLFVRTGNGLTESALIQTALTSAGVSWRLNSIQYEQDTGLTHIEWVFTAEGVI